MIQCVYTTVHDTSCYCVWVIVSWLMRLPIDTSYSHSVQQNTCRSITLKRLTFCLQGSKASHIHGFRVIWVCVGERLDCQTSVLGFDEWLYRNVIVVWDTWFVLFLHWQFDKFWGNISVQGVNSFRTKCHVIPSCFFRIQYSVDSFVPIHMLLDTMD